MKNIIYHKEQRFTKWVSIPVFVLFLGFFLSYKFKPEFNINILDVALIGLVAFILFGSKLIIDVTTEKDLVYQFFPFQFKSSTICHNEIDHSYLKKYIPLGWGLRYQIFDGSIAYIFSGNLGLQLELKNGKKIMFGIPQATEIKELLS